MRSVRCAAIAASSVNCQGVQDRIAFPNTGADAHHDSRAASLLVTPISREARR
jgi:hypothetical protein